MSHAEINTIAVSWRDYLELCKPNVVALMVLTSLIGMLLATDQAVPMAVLIFGNLGIALCSGSAAAVNHIVDRHVDDKMARTLNRPLAQGRLKTEYAVIFALITGIIGMAILLVFTNVLTAWLTLASLVGYAFIYTMFFEARDAAKYCHRRPSRRYTTTAGMDGSDGRNSPQRTVISADYFCLDATTFLGVGRAQKR